MAGPIESLLIISELIVRLGGNLFINIEEISENYHIKKPNEEFFKALIKKNKIKDAIMIGNDYFADIIPAKLLGLKTIYIETETSRKTVGVSKIKGFDKKKILNQITILTSHDSSLR